MPGGGSPPGTGRHSGAAFDSLYLPTTCVAYVTFGDGTTMEVPLGGALDQIDLGDPTSTRSYVMCVYDESSGVSSLATKLEVGPDAALWTSNDPKGFTYKAPNGLEDGVVSVKLKTGEAGKSSVSLTAKGQFTPLPAPVSASQYFAQDGSVVVQLFNNETMACWSSEFPGAVKNTAEQYKAKTP